MIVLRLDIFGYAIRFRHICGFRGIFCSLTAADKTRYFIEYAWYHFHNAVSGCFRLGIERQDAGIPIAADNKETDWGNRDAGAAAAAKA